MHIIRNANLALNLRVKGTVLNRVNVKNNFMTPQKHIFKASLDWFFSSASVLELSELHTDCVLNNGDLISFSTSIGHTKNVEKQITQSKGIVALSISKIMSIYFEHAERSRSSLLSCLKATRARVLPGPHVEWCGLFHRVNVPFIHVSDWVQAKASGSPERFFHIKLEMVFSQFCQLPL